ncbi:MAG: [ribosomal protein S5]-alanine N-acetyltransferase [Thermoanaerobacteraceae bacterium]|jgi:ribosomal-protein-alanine N-acetyltransferase|nr:[ribosomal protein S5]-alanine N-acetyltransferase [Thermoanaerobacteraceae bacterium]
MDLQKDDDDKIIGSIAFNNIVRGAYQLCHLGYKMDKDEINKGYATEAIKMGLRLFSMNINCIE